MYGTVPYSLRKCYNIEDSVFLNTGTGTLLVEWLLIVLIQNFLSFTGIANITTCAKWKNLYMRFKCEKNLAENHCTGTGYRYLQKDLRS
jgi:hypothetical protein